MSDFVRAYYDAHAAEEQRRLDAPLCRVEFASTLRLVEKYFPPQGRVCDIGGATGRYTLELLRKGFNVTLLDLSPQEIRLAELELRRGGLSAECLLVGDACDLRELASGEFDAALMLGPLYHLIEPGARARALSELRRVLKPGGVAILAYLNAWGLLRTGLTDFPAWYRDLPQARSLLDPRIFPGQTLDGFTECAWSTPPAALAEVRAAGFELISYAGAEGFAGGLAGVLAQIAARQPDAYENIVTLAVETCELPQYRDAADHLHLVVHKPIP